MPRKHVYVLDSFIILRLLYFLIQAGEPPRRYSLLYYIATDGGSTITPNLDHRNYNHLKSVRGEDSELGGFTLSFSAAASNPTYNHMITHTPGYEHIQKVLGYGFEMKHISEGESSHENLCL